MNHCKDCRHWADPKEAIELGCDSSEGSDYGLCKLMRSAGPRDGVLAYPDEQAGMVADLRTRADFGCVQFEAKPLTVNQARDLEDIVPYPRD